MTQEFRADLHIHSRFSRATSRALNLPVLAGWAAIKGLSVVGTGDFSHPEWRDEMRDLLEFEEKSGLYRLKDPTLVAQNLPDWADHPLILSRVAEIRFLLQTEISSIYKRDGRVRKVHNLIYMPHLEAADNFSLRLAEVGNIASDGRPILGLDSERLLEMLLQFADSYLIPAHIWTPWFSLFGSKSGFDRIEDCYGSLTPHIFALETGLSSDPEMNRHISALDGYKLISNSDAHSGENLAREANIFTGEISYAGIFDALKAPNSQDNALSTKFIGTYEFFPDEGKYHLDGHRACNVALEPHQSRRYEGICPSCGKPLTLGVLYRVQELADRSEPVYRPDESFKSLIPLPEIIGEVLRVGPKTRKVGTFYQKILADLGSELDILLNVPIADIARHSAPLAEGINRMRQGKVLRRGGYDGEYGVISVFSPEEQNELKARGSLRRGFKASSALLPGMEAAAAAVAKAKTPARPKNDSKVKKKNSPSSTAEPNSAADLSCTTNSGSTAKITSAKNNSGLTAAHAQSLHDVKESGLLSGSAYEKNAKAASGGASGTPHASVAYTLDGETSKKYTVKPQEQALSQTTAQDNESTGNAKQAQKQACSAPAPASLNSRQTEAVQAEGPVLTLAGPGTGKTHTLAERVRQLISSGTSPRRILAVTFTRRAARELDERLSAILADLPGMRDASGKLHLPRTDTLHALAYEFWHRVQGQSPILLNDDEAFRVFSEAASEETAAKRKSAWQSINLAREKRQPIPGELQDYFDRYSTHKNTWNLTDYIDLLEFWLTQAESGKYPQPWQHILVDEIQDLSPLQLDLIKSICPEGGQGFFGIGDPNQSIYGFRGAHGQVEEFFKKAWPKTAIIQLQENYRSAAPIIKLAQNIFDDLPGVGNLVPMQNCPAEIHYFEANSAESEATWIAGHIRQILGASSHSLLDADKNVPNDAYSPGDFAILMRNRALMQPVRRALDRLGLPISQPSADPFWNEPRVVKMLQIVGRMLGISLPLPDAGKEQRLSMPECPDKVLMRGPSSMAAYWGNSEPFDARFWKSREFKELSEAFETHEGWEGLLNWLSLQNELELVRHNSEKIQLLTMHAAKGLEFRIVFIAGLEDGLVPFAGKEFLSGHPPQGMDLDEEKRLFYVAATRAKERLFLSRAERRFIFAREFRLPATRFLSNMPIDMVKHSRMVAKTSSREEHLKLI